MIKLFISKSTDCKKINILLSTFTVSCHVYICCKQIPVRDGFIKRRILGRPSPSRTCKNITPLSLELYLLNSMRVLHAPTFPDVHLCRVNTSRLEKT